MNIPADAVYASAAEIERHMHGPIKLGELTRAALEAAAPHMLAAKVDEARANHAHIIPGGDGYSAGFHYALQCIYSGDE